MLIWIRSEGNAGIIAEMIAHFAKFWRVELPEEVVKAAILADKPLFVRSAEARDAVTALVKLVAYDAEVISELLPPIGIYRSGE